MKGFSSRRLVLLASAAGLACGMPCGIPCCMPWRPNWSKNFSKGDPGFASLSSLSPMPVVLAVSSILTRTEITAGFTFATTSANPADG